MAKAQELSLNMIVVGSLALLVLLIIGGVMIFGGSDLMSGLTGMGPSSEEVSQTTFLSQCRSKCNSLNLELQSVTNWYDQLQSTFVWYYTTPSTLMQSIKDFCCYSTDLNGNGQLEMTGSSGPEYCSKAYAQSCTIDGLSPAVFCKKAYSGQSGGYAYYYDFTSIAVYSSAYYHTCMQ
jgi:hypothetical protein